MTATEFPWLDKTEYPFQSNYFNINGHRLHFIDEGKGEALLFVHGTPTWSFDFRKIIKNLKSDFRCIALDHIGFGLSDKPKEYDYSTFNHSLTLEKLALAHKLDSITLVVHDFGGPIGLNFAIRHPNLIKRIIILNSWLWSSEGEPEFVRFSKILRSPLLPFLYRRLNFSPRFILPKSYGVHKPSKSILKHYTKPFADRYQRNGALAFAKSLLNDQDWFEELWNQKSQISDKPVLFLWGMKDPIITPKYLEKFEQGFSKSKTVKLEESGHFPQEEEAEKVVKSVRGFLGS
ncbi:alpha/beta fold hydrolase [Aquiflexum sp.]|uniref:alpha/beta fold hydrolase n=1 Tax=Aquiflexum sp. TaxID=1872584 RepID=UPI0035934D25